MESVDTVFDLARADEGFTLDFQNHHRVTDLARLNSYKILMISGKRKLDVSNLTWFSDADSRLEMIARRLVENENLPLILWNLTPSNNFNILHGIYLVKLSQCIDLGFNCVTVIFDKSVEKELEIPLQERPLVREFVKNCIRWLIKAGLNEDKTEFIAESDLWSFIKFEDFAEKITSLSRICSISSGLAGKENAASIIMDNLSVIYYEDLIKCDVLLAGKKDENNLLINKLCLNYIPPLILWFPTLKGLDGNDLSVYSDNNSLSIRHTREELKRRIRDCPIEFLEMLFSFLIIPLKKKLVINNKSIYTWEELCELMQISDIKNLAFDYIDQYFFYIRGREL